MTSLIFHTPSKRCPLREWNGLPCSIDGPAGKSFVRRVGRRVDLYLITIHSPEGPVQGFAIPDELFVIPWPTEEELYEYECTEHPFLNWPEWKWAQQQKATLPLFESGDPTLAHQVSDEFGHGLGEIDGGEE